MSIACECSGIEAVYDSTKACISKMRATLGVVLHCRAFHFCIVILSALEGFLLVALLMLEIEKLQSKVGQVVSDGDTPVCRPQRSR